MKKGRRAARIGERHDGHPVTANHAVVRGGKEGWTGGFSTMGATARFSDLPPLRLTGQPFSGRSQDCPSERYVFNGNLDGEVETIARTSHLFLPFPDTVRNDMAFHDRWHAYLPGWELPKMQPGYFTGHMGFIADYIAE